jgi:hypothetical protein
MSKTDSERILRIERAVAELAHASAMVHGRGHVGAATREIQADLEAVAESEARKQRASALEAELASLRAA